MTQNIFSLLSKALWLRIIVVIIYYFYIWNKKEHNIICDRVICNHIGPMYIETPYICFAQLAGVVEDTTCFSAEG